MEKLYLHIGSPKTGSTSIQEIYANNRSFLEDQSFIYPGKNVDHHLLYFASKCPKGKWVGHFKGMNPQEIEIYVQKFFKDLEEDFKKDKHVVMSTEYLFFEDRMAIENICHYLRQFFSKIEVFVFLRDPVDFYKSSQQQGIKVGSYINSPNSFKYIFKDVINTWEIFCDKFNVLEFKKSGNAFEKLCNKIGIDTSTLRNLGHRSKGSVSIEQMVLLEKIFCNLYNFKELPLEKRIHLKTIAQINAPFTTKPELQDWVRPIIYQNHREDLQWLHQEYGIDFLDKQLEDQKVTLSNLKTFENGKATIRDIYKVPSEESINKFEALVVDLLLKKFVQRV